MTSSSDIPRSDIQALSHLVALAAILQILESLIPHPVPGIRLGLANVVTLIALIDKGFIFGLQLAFLRTIVSGMILGTLLTPPFVLSMTASISSCLVMGGLIWCATRFRTPPMSVIGISTVGAVTHAVTQLYIAYAILFREKSILLLLPWLVLAAVVSGWLTGLLARSVLLRLSDLSSSPSISDNTLNLPDDTQESSRSPSSSYSLSPGFRRTILTLTLLTLSAAIVLSTPHHLLLPLGLMLLLMIPARIPLSATRISLSKASSLILISVLLPMLSIHSGPVLADLGFVSIHERGASSGLTLGLRMLIVVCAGLLISRLVAIDQFLKHRSHAASSGVTGRLQYLCAVTAASLQLTSRDRDNFRERFASILKHHGLRHSWRAISIFLAELYAAPSRRVTQP